MKSLWIFQKMGSSPRKDGRLFQWRILWYVSLGHTLIIPCFLSLPTFLFALHVQIMNLIKFKPCRYTCCHCTNFFMNSFSLYIFTVVKRCRDGWGFVYLLSLLSLSMYFFTRHSYISSFLMTFLSCIYILQGASTNLLDKTSHQTTFCAWDTSPHLPTTPVQLMRPGIGRNTSCDLHNI